MKRCTHCPPLHASCSRAHWSARRQRGRPSPTAERIKATASQVLWEGEMGAPPSLAPASPPHRPSEVCVLDDDSAEPNAPLHCRASG